MDNRVLVIGGGIAGVQAALDLAQMGVQVSVLEEAPSIGGRMAQLDKTFPTNDCSTCILSPKLIELSSHPLVDILSFSSIEHLEKRDGKFSARIREKARFVDPEKCTACGMCAEKCPVRIPDLFNRNIKETKCIHIPYAQAVPAVYRIEKEHCLYLKKGKCGVCSKVCEPKAINYEDQDRISEHVFNAVILSPGTGEYSPRIRPEYGYHIYPNVITSIEYERYLSASGPTGGHIMRPSDGKEPERIAFIQCVGSRDNQEGNNSYCSSFCCMQATKDAIITREHAASAESTIFYIDLRTYGKGFDRYVERAKHEYGVRYIRSRVSEIQENPENGNLSIMYLRPDGTHDTEEFDLVVLSIGIRTSPSVRNLLDQAGIVKDDSGFPLVSLYDRTSISVEGIFACGTITGPMDIPETVVSASAAAGAAAGLLRKRAVGNGRGEYEPDVAVNTGVTEIPETDIRGTPPRIGVVVCRCGTNISSVVDVPAVVEKVKTLRNVVFASDTIYACAKDSLSVLVDRNAAAAEAQHHVDVVVSTVPDQASALQNLLRHRNGNDLAGLDNQLREVHARGRIVRSHHGGGS